MKRISSVSLSLLIIILVVAGLSGCIFGDKTVSEKVISPKSADISLKEIVTRSDGIAIGQITAVSEGFITSYHSDKGRLIVETDASFKIDKWLVNKYSLPDRVVISMPEGESVGASKTYISDRKKSLYANKKVLILFKSGTFDGKHSKLIPTGLQGVFYFDGDSNLAKLDPDAKPSTTLQEIEKHIKELKG